MVKHREPALFPKTMAIARDDLSSSVLTVVENSVRPLANTPSLFSKTATFLSYLCHLNQILTMKHYLLLSLLALSTTLFSQLNSTLRSQLDYDVAVNDIWGYVAPDGTEYAIVGLDDGVSFVSLADPDDIREVVKVAGANSIWRDMKTFGEYAYNVADQGSEGISAFDLRFLPDSVPFKKTTYPDIVGNGREFIQAHNIYIDTNHGRLYTAGGSRQINDGGILIFDLTADPMTPTYIGKGPATYSHDVYVVDDTLYCSEIYDGELAMYDIADLDNPITLGAVVTPFSFTHNAWTTDDEQFIFTTDERGNAPVAAYDISDKQDIKKTFEFRPLGSLNTGTIPHNVHVINDYLSVSYYTDGLIVADASKPDNIIEIANYDTWTGSDGGFNGDWGAYPFLPSGLTLVSDRSTGLYVIEVDYKRAARLEGIITRASTGLPINNVNVSINSSQANGVTTNGTGDYKTGIANAGNFEVTFTAENYRPLTVSVSMDNDVCLRLDTSLIFIQPVDVSLNIVDDETGDPIQGATFRIDGESTRSTTSSADGNVSLNEVATTASYKMYVAQWGYQTISEDNIDPIDLVGRTIRLTRRYMDDFVTDEGWEATNVGASSGFWVRETPIGTSFGSVPVNPGADAEGDFGTEAYITGNGGGGAGNDDVDGGTVILTSPMFQDLGLSDLKVSYQYWFANDGGDPPLNDNLVIKVSNGRETVVARIYEANGDASWTTDSFLISDFVEITDSLQIIVETDDSAPNGHIVEAGFDNFLVYGRTIPSSTENYGADGFTATIFPNPTSESFQLIFEGVTLNQATLRVTNVTGQVVSEQKVNGESVVFGQSLPTGTYFAEVFEGRTRIYTTKLVKQ
jgi:choice-of-anchor B domain-containing protein